MFKTDFIIFYEHVSRELEGCQSLALELNKRGFSGYVLPIHFYRRIRVALLRPKIIIVPFIYSSRNSTHLDFEKVYGSIPCLDLHSEQIVDETTRHMYSPIDEYARSSYHISWSDEFAKILIESGVNREKIFITGSIRNDSIINNQKPLPSDSKILICTSFSNTFVAPSYIDHVLEDHDIEPEQYRKKIEITREVRDFYFAEIHRYAQCNPDIQIVIRPHPYVEISDFINAYLEVNDAKLLPANVLVERRGSVQDAINATRYVVCWQSSVLLDAQLMGRSTFLMQHRDIPNYMEVPFSKVAANICSLNEVVDTEENKLLANVDIESIYGSIDGKASKRVAEAVLKISKSSSKNNKISVSQYLLVLIHGIVVDFAIVFLNKIRLADKIFPLLKGLSEDSPFYRYTNAKNKLAEDKIQEIKLGEHGNEFK